MRGMKFSLRAMFVLMTLSAVALWVCMKRPVDRSSKEIESAARRAYYDLARENPRISISLSEISVASNRPPRASEVAIRLAMLAPLVIVGSAAILWVAHRTW